ncbi:MAG: hypothetical protein CM15mP120_19570 [Pseudomonadota bacterium]|nr:MAG: hypothetical protein CM15mP120_19570 [Pseudomonadota bacterium]
MHHTRVSGVAKRTALPGRLLLWRVYKSSLKFHIAEALSLRQSRLHQIAVWPAHLTISIHRE